MLCASAGWAVPEMIFMVWVESSPALRRCNTRVRQLAIRKSRHLPPPGGGRFAPAGRWPKKHFKTPCGRGKIPPLFS